MCVIIKEKKKNYITLDLVSELPNKQKKKTPLAKGKKSDFYHLFKIGDSHPKKKHFALFKECIKKLELKELVFFLSFYPRCVKTSIQSYLTQEDLDNLTKDQNISQPLVDEFLRQCIDPALKKITKLESISVADLRELIATFITLQLEDPGSMQSFSRKAHEYIGSSSFTSKNSVYTLPQILSEHAPEVMDAICGFTLQLLDEKISHILSVDTTNTSIYSDRSDSELKAEQLEDLEIMITHAKQALSELNPSSNESARRKTEALKKQLKKLNRDKARIEKFIPFAQRGKSKEHSKDPLVGVALVTAQNGLVIDSMTYPGNRNDAVNVVPILERLLDKGVHRKTLSFDAGCYSLENCLKINEANYDFCMVAKLGRFSAEEIEHLTSLERTPISGDFSYDSYAVSEIEKRNKKTGKVLHAKVLILFSPAKRYRDLDILDQNYKRAKEFVKSKCSLLGKSTQSTSLCSKNEGKATGINEKRLKKRQQAAGFTFIIFTDTHAEHPVNIEDLLHLYKYQLQVEENFHILKSVFSLRPLYTRKQSSIEGLVLCMVLGLNFLRYVRLKLAQDGLSLSLLAIQDTLRKAKVSVFSVDGLSGMFYRKNSIITVPLQTMERDNPTIDKKQLRSASYLLDRIMNILGLETLPSKFNSRVFCQIFSCKKSFARLAHTDAS